MSRLLVATRSRPKLLEIEGILGSLGGVDLCSPADLGLAEDPEEDSIEAFETFEENALAKARWFHDRTGIPSVADDSGLEVDALGRRPGVRSKRFAASSFQLPEESRSEANMRFLLRELNGVPDEDRGARFVCVAAVAGIGGDPMLHRGEVSGRILSEPRGDGGFGYDPIFLAPDLGRSFAELTMAEKAARSHRGRAFGALRIALEASGADAPLG